MTATDEYLTWSFGGPLAGHAPGVRWAVLASVAVFGLVLVGLSYRYTLAALPPKRRAVLGGVRSVLWLALLAVLAGPTRIHRTYELPAARPLAVLVDRSASMTTVDNRQRRRLDDALRRWREMEPAARSAFRESKVFAFAGSVEPVTSVDGAPALPTEPTRLFATLHQILDQAPAGGWGGIVTLTDGLDTTGARSPSAIDAVTSAASAGGTPLFFVPGRNRYAGAPFFGLREFSAPTQAAPRSTFRVEATFEGFQTEARSLDVHFTLNGVARPTGPLRLEAGRRITAWSAEVATDAPGVLEIELRVGDQIARSVVRVELPPSNRILYFQGALDWSYRFLADILKRDASFVVTPVFNFPNPNAVLPPGALRRLPEIPRELEAFDIVILANAAAAQFTPAQQTGLAAWVREGGVLLFFTPDDDSSQGFAGSELEKILPVVFAASARQSRENLASRGLASWRRSAGAADATKLVAFAWEDSPRVREIFAAAGKGNGPIVAPLFAEYARVAHAKPGADVLARHPTDLAADGSERSVLLAIQRYGRGQAGVLTTDALWRWKLHQPAAERGAELFWQNLLAWLTRERQFGLRFDRPPHMAVLDEDVSLRLLGASPEPVEIAAVSGEKRILLSEGSREGNARVFAWRPPVEGFWAITATDATGRNVGHGVSVTKGARAGENSGAAPDEELMQELASRTGGAVLENAPPAGWREVRSGRGELLAEVREPRWHRAWIYGGMLGLYGAEMILRRKWKLL